MAYASASDVAALTRNLLGPATEYDDLSTCPTLSQVTAWLSSGCSLINSKLGSENLGPIPQSSGAYDLAKEVNALFAAWMAERSRTNARIAADERTRADMLKKDFESLLDMLTGLDLSFMGVGELTTTGTAYAGGISISDKSSVEGDADRVKPRFERDMFRNPLSGQSHATGS